MSADLASKIFIFSVGGLAFAGILLRAIADLVSLRTSKKLYRFLYAFCISLIILLPMGTCWWLYISGRFRSNHRAFHLPSLCCHSVFLL